MNYYKQLVIECDGICELIRAYTGDSKINNYLSQLEIAVKNADYENIKYCLENLNNWYDLNISAIKVFEYPQYFDSHCKSRELIKTILANLTADDCCNNEKKQNELHKNPIIFISHKSDDKKYGDALRNYIIGLGVKDNQLIYTSHPLNKIPMDENIYEYLRKNINSDIFMIILWSDKYLESPACLNEMGAAWVTQADYTNIYVPTFSFGNPKYHECAVDTRKMGAVLNGDQHCKSSMIELRQKIQKMFNLGNDEQKSNFLLDEFIKAITEDSRNGKIENALGE